MAGVSTLPLGASLSLAREGRGSVEVSIPTTERLTVASGQAASQGPPSSQARTHHTLLALVWSTTSRLPCTSSTSSGAVQRSGTHSWSAVTR